MAGPTLRRRQLLGVVGAAGVGSLGGCTTAVDGRWPMQGHDSRRSWSNERDSGPGSSLSVAWRTEIGTLDRPDATSSPVVAGGRVVVGLVYQVDSKRNEGGFAALDGQGDVEWSVRTDDAQPRAPVLTDELLLHLEGDHRVVARSIEDGEVAWTYDTDLLLDGSARLDGDALLLGSADGQVLALGADDGERRWQFEFDEQYATAPLVGEAGDMVTTTEHSVVGFHPAEQSVRWRLSRPDRYRGSLVGSGSFLLGNTEDSPASLRAIDLASGEDRWTTAAPAGHLGRLSVADGELLAPVSSDSAAIVAHDLETGDRQWTVSTDAAGLRRVVAGARHGYVETVDDRLLAVDLEEQAIAAELALDDAVANSRFVVAGDRLYAAGWSGATVAAFE